ncbi:MAG: hypothetical protein MJZ60_09330 [Bacteroidaceae bacterium]|nr:hypothetical protein [Bacteroidaceae bacterium]
MKKFLLSLSLFAMTLMAGAQVPTLKARSIYDVNQDDKVTVQDVPALTNKLLGKADDKTAVDTQSLLSVLNNLADQYANLVSQYGKILAELADLKAKVSSCTCSGEGGAGKKHDYVVMGGKKWSTMNLGATTVAGSYATCAGDFYAWGETTPRYTSISWSGSTASFTGISKPYNGNNYPSYTGSTLDAAHDAVASHADWGEGWRTPTNQDFKDLYAACGGTGSYISSTLPSGSKSTTAKGIYWCSNYDGVAGLLFCDGTNKLFFPASGDVYDTSHYDGGSFGLYWSSSLYTSDIDCAYLLNFNASHVNPSSYYGRYNGFAVRPVSD